MKTPTITLAPFDWAPHLAAWRRAFEDVGKAMQNVGQAFRALSRTACQAMNEEVNVCGLEARFLVRGGLTEDIDYLVLTLLLCPWEIEPSLRLLTPPSRARLAAAAIRGHVGHYG